jgi:hypothetical protein
MEQDQRGIKHRYYAMRGFGSVAGAARVCSAHFRYTFVAVSSLFRRMPVIPMCEDE